MKLYTKDKKVYEIDGEPLPCNYLRAYDDCEGNMHYISEDVAAKIMHKSKRTEFNERNIKAMIDSSLDKSTEFLAWPKEILYDKDGIFFGYTVKPYPYLMKPLDEAARDKNLCWMNKLKLATNLSSAIKNAHEIGYITCELDIENNVFYDTYSDNGYLSIIDCDSFQIISPQGSTKYQNCFNDPNYKTLSTAYLAPELHEEFYHDSCIHFTKESDYFSLAVLIYQLLSDDIHPFGFIVSDDENILGEPAFYLYPENILQGRCFLFPETCEGHKIKMLEYANKLDLSEIFPPDICDLFKRTFVDGHKDPKKRATAEEWHTALSELLQNLKQCDRNSMHYYHKDLKKCPWCLNEERKKLQVRKMEFRNEKKTVKLLKEK